MRGENALDRKYPENDDNTLFIRHCSGPITFQELREQIENHFGPENLDTLWIDSGMIQEKCFGYDLYDPADYGKYFIISRD